MRGLPLRADKNEMKPLGLFMGVADDVVDVPSGGQR